MASRDYEEFIAALNAHGVRYLIIGAHAVALHAVPRATRDLDVLIDPTRTNARRVLKALRDFFGGTDLGYAAKDLLDSKSIIQLGVAPVRIDLMTAVPGLTGFATAWRGRVDGRFGSEPAHYLGLDDLLKSKSTTRRPQDLADLEVLERARRSVKPRRKRP